MSVVIEQSAISAAAADAGSIDHAVAAGRACLERAGVAPDDIDVLINVGVYRDGNVVEPANSALIQLGLDMHRDYEAGSGRSTFSLDLRNGACGVLNAVQAASALLINGTADRVLIVGSDAHPGGIAHAPADFRYATTGAAWLLGKGVDRDSGFGTVHIPPARGRRAGTNPGVDGYLDLKAMGTEGQRSITVEVAQDYESVLAVTAAETVSDYLAAQPRLDPARAVLVTNNPAPGFAADLAEKFGFARGYQAMTGDRDAGSSGLAIAYQQLREQGELSPGDELLLLAAGSGPMAACVSYRVEGAE
ncbi:hypothetical protein [Nocardia transvalensis]|uniref:hypothetical protein n=1 Tax=Nocardia transvalensis TaxID=37333 RepID=UPI0018954C83|nr:hypothetical protein [Nocardia transvalensis]MBF6330768.1 hypothetical protein [Nocardia transvalensis]